MPYLDCIIQNAHKRNYLETNGYIHKIYFDKDLDLFFFWSIFCFPFWRPNFCKKLNRLIFLKNLFIYFILLLWPERFFIHTHHNQYGIWWLYETHLKSICNNIRTYCSQNAPKASQSPFISFACSLSLSLHCFLVMFGPSFDVGFSPHID